ncbi:MAG TPA: TIGR00730 family Rossman fold protein [Anaeromyxobacteraceae bacterium]|nr:TIGR00730 family Rossman fold protein [Anaeromyxobacteraceae bacterium]
MTLRRVCVFCGSAVGARPAYRRAAARLGEALARRGLGLVYGGGSVGLMGVVADAALAAGGEVVGVIPRRMARKEIAHAGLSRLHVVPSMHARKAMMADLCDAFVAMPGGMGTLEELTEVLTWAQLGLHHKPCALLDVAGYWRPLIRLFDHAVEERFLRREHRGLLLVERGPERVLDRLARWRPPLHLRKWIDRRAT